MPARSQTRAPLVAVSGSGVSETVPLRYVARAGLLPELTSQTYDSLYKALREAILNSVDAGATEVSFDLSTIASDRVAQIIDNGCGMTIQELQQSFMSLGGSRKFSDHQKFGRIGIGSLALMHYASSVEIETKVAGESLVTRAVLSHPWSLGQTERGTALSEFVAGRAWCEPTSDHRDDHYTVIRLIGVDDVFVAECSDITAFYRLLDRLRRVLPLPWPRTELTEQLAEVSPEAAEAISAHAAQFSAHVLIHSQWGSEESLTKRVYGEGGSQEEEWNGRPHPFLRDLRVHDDEGERLVQAVGYLVSQVRQVPSWTGLTARVQNVAVEEQTFFDLESDPGFRKYLTGEVWILGDIDRSRLVKIDRASFNREAPDYKVVARFMQSEISRVKAEYVQAPQRAKAAIKRRLDDQVALVTTMSKLSHAASLLIDGLRSLPSSRNGTIKSRRDRGLVDDLQRSGAVVVIGSRANARHPYRLSVDRDGRRVLAELDEALAAPRITFGRSEYLLRVMEGDETDPAVLIKNRPREILLNLSHDVFASELRPAAVEVVMALELAYLLKGSEADDVLYDRVLQLLSTRARGRLGTASI